MNFIRGLLGVGLLASASYMGFANFPLWSVPALSLFFTAAYIQGKWYLWNRLFQQQNRQLYQSLLVTYLIQTGLVFVFYLLGSGVARLFTR